MKRSAIRRLYLLLKIAGMSLTEALQIFGLSPQDLTKEKIIKKYKELALANHPDKAPPEEAISFNKKMVEINQAFEVLKNNSVNLSPGNFNEDEEIEQRTMYDVFRTPIDTEGYMDMVEEDPQEFEDRKREQELLFKDMHVRNIKGPRYVAQKKQQLSHLFNKINYDEIKKAVQLLYKYLKELDKNPNGLKLIDDKTYYHFVLDMDLDSFLKEIRQNYITILTSFKEGDLSEAYFINKVVDLKLKLVSFTKKLHDKKEKFLMSPESYSKSNQDYVNEHISKEIANYIDHIITTIDPVIKSIDTFLSANSASWNPSFIGSLNA